MSDWLQLATSRATVVRSLKYAVVVGSVLIAINHGDALVAGDLPGSTLVRMGLTALVPYLVSTFASVAAYRDGKGALGTRAEPETSETQKHV